MRQIGWMNIRRSYFLICIFVLAVLILVTGCVGFDKEESEEHSDEGSSGADHSDYVVLEEVPDWGGDESKPYIEINGNVPEFDEKIIRQAKEAADAGSAYRLEVFEELDRRGRCGSAVACVGRETMPEGERGSIGMVKPSGWQLDKYDFIDNGGFLYNRCHLIGWQLTGQNEEERNLITGTRYLNTQGMLPFENKVAGYVRLTGKHVLYRATPIFKGKELVARGVQLEALSLENNGAGLSFNVYCYNVQPGVKINYKTGKNKLDEATLPAGIVSDGENTELDVPEGVTYILNTNTMRFHRTDCEGVLSMSEDNREWFYGTREEAIKAGYVPCGMCEP